MSKKQATSRNVPVIYRVDDISFNNVEVSDLNMTGQQPIAYINYRDSNNRNKILIQTDKFRLTSHGIPRIHEQYYPTDDKREFIKIPIDDNGDNQQHACAVLRKHFVAADKFFGSNELRQKLFGKKEKKYEYQPILRTPVKFDNDDDDDDDNNKNNKKNGDKKQYPVVDFCKMKFNVVKQDKDRIIRTKFTKIVNGEKEPFKPHTITEIAAELTWNTEMRCIFYYSKIWANKTPLNGSKFILYGVGIKVMSIGYTPVISHHIKPEDLEFLSEVENDEETKEEVKAIVNAKPAEKHKGNEKSNLDNKKAALVKKPAKFDSEDDSDSEEKTKMPAPKVNQKNATNEPPKFDSDDDSVDDKKPKMKTKETPKDDSDDSVEELLNKKTKAKSKVQERNDDSDNDQIDVKKKQKKVKNFDTSEESEKEIKPVKKAQSRK